VKFEAEIDLAAGTSKCNCTSCWKKRNWSVRAQPEGFRRISGDDQMSGYQPGSPNPAHGFCKSCGVFTYAWVGVTEWNPTAYVSVSVASLDDLEPAELIAAPVQFCDGRADNWWNVPGETRHL
jgi:hypothetical protein